VRSLVFNPVNDKILLSGSVYSGDLRVWNTETGQCLSKLQGHDGSIFSLAAYGDGSYFTSVGTDRKLMIWDVRVNKSVSSIDA